MPGGMVSAKRDSRTGTDLASLSAPGLLSEEEVFRIHFFDSKLTDPQEALEDLIQDSKLWEKDQSSRMGIGSDILVSY